MLTSIKQRLGHDDEQGFTLIELMVVVLIIAILLAIAIPTFLGARSSSNARAAQSSLRNALTAEQTYFTNNSQAFGAGTIQMSTIEPNLTWLAAVPTTAGPNSIWTITSDTNQQVLLQAFAKDGNCYSIFQNNDPAVVQANNTLYNMHTGTCAANPVSTALAPLAVTLVPPNASAASSTNWFATW